MSEIKEMAMHNQIQNLSNLYVLLASTLAPTVIVGREDAQVLPCPFSPALKGAAEVALIEICNRISDMVRDSQKWTFDKSNEAAYLTEIEEAATAKQMAMLQQVFGPPVPEKKTRKKGNK